MPAGAAQKQPDAKGKQAVAPGDAAIFAQDWAGAYFIARPLKKKYHLLRSERLRFGRTSARPDRFSQRPHHIAALQAELKKLLLQNDATKLYIPGAKIQTRIETTMIPIAAADLFLSTARVSRSRGGAGLEIECVLEKTVLDEDETRFDADFAGIKLVARKATGNEFFGFYKSMKPGASRKFAWNGFIFKEFIYHQLLISRSRV